MRLGADPEVFLQRPNGGFISSIGYINADKWHPYQIPDMPKGFTLQEDNVSLEYGIPPAASAEEFIKHITAVMEKSKEYLPDLTFSKLSCVVFPEDQMGDPRAHQFGCEPDFNAWTNTPNFSPTPSHPYMRSAGGHVHVETKLNPTAVVQAMDLYLGVASILMDKGEERKQMYGKAGAHRPKPYGVEYRVLSNFWIFEPKLIKWVWDNTEMALQVAQLQQESGENLLSDLSDTIQECINNNDKKKAEQLCHDYRIATCF